MNRGRNVLGSFIGARGFNQYIHNHKDVADVKFVNWTNNVFTELKTSEAADRFCSLSYHMLYANFLKN